MQGDSAISSPIYSHAAGLVLAKKSSGQIRIIGGRWRGRRLPVPDLPGLRPTTDRIKETIFNWIQFDVPGRHVADVFAGTGSLGIEALSRGATSAVFFDNSQQAVKQLQQNLKVLAPSGTASLLNSGPLQAGTRKTKVTSAETASQDSDTTQRSAYYEIINGDAVQLLEQLPPETDLIFLDPPFGKGLLQQSIDVLSKITLRTAETEELSNNSLNGSESGPKTDLSASPAPLIYVECEKGLPISFPEHWHLRKEKHMGQVTSRLFEVQP